MKPDALKWLSTDDLRAIQSGDFSKVSTRGLQLLQSGAPAVEKPVDPSEGGSTLQFGPFDTGIPISQGLTRFLAGAGKGMTDLARGAGQAVGLVSRQDIDEANKLDRPLMNTGAGIAGTAAGQLALLAPALMTAGPSLATATALGAGQGALQPTGTNESTLKNAVIGGALGAAGPVAVRAGTAAYQGGRALVEPFTQVGRERIAGRVLQRFAESPENLGAAAAVMGPTRTGALPTLAEQTGDRGIARLQDALRTLDPEIGNAIERQLVGNNAARVERLREVVGTRDAAVAARQQQAGPMYQRALGEQIDPSLAPAGQELLQSPAIAEAAGQARTNALNAGTQLGGDGSVRGLHSAKLALDDMIAAAERGDSAGQVNRAASLRAARDRLVGYIEQASPEYQAARTTYAQASRPVNQADVADELLRATSNTTDLPMVAGDAGVPRIQTDAFLRKLRDGEKTVSKATGRNLGALEDVLDPGQMALVRSIGNEVDRSAAVVRAGNGPGSATAQRMASQNLLRQLAGPTGLPSSWVESALLSNALRPVQFAYGTAEPAIQQVLARGLLDTGYAGSLLQAAGTGATTSPLLQQGLLGGSRLLPTAGLLSGER